MSKQKCPVCGMDAKSSIKSEYQGKTYNFCCESCKEKFEEDPQEYVKHPAHASRS